MADILVAYFSATGTTKETAKKVADAVGADAVEIVPKKAYTAADLDWQNKKSRSSVEMQDASSRPELAAAAPDLSGYSKIVIGFPVWWYTAPRIINSFLESGKFEGKTVFLFATSGGSGIGGAVKDLQKAYPQIHFAEGRLLNGAVKAEEIRDWLG